MAWADATNIYIRFANKGSVFSGGNKTDGSAFNPDNTDWGLIVYAF